ncbi:MAG: GNAT family N-acetyltransferase [Actinomycetota bacterium]|nr:GNAT family N-acetyltransferase [Actinomycetota bacterium]
MNPPAEVSSDGITIRDVVSTDRDQWEELWTGYTGFYRKTVAPEITDLTFGRLCERDQGMFGLVAESRAGRLVGLAHCIPHRSTWSEGWKCYLEDLFVDRSSRGANVGAKLIEAAKERSREEGANRLYWLTQPYNGAARSLYDQVGHLASRVVYESNL